MRLSFVTASAAALLGLAACTAAPQTSSTQMAPAAAGSSSAMPQTRNSLPAGDVVNAPRAAPTGQVGTTRTY